MSDFIINTKLSMYEYVAMVAQIAEEFFSPDGEYQPHIGRLNAMRLFYNICVESSKFDDTVPHNITEAEDIIPLVEDSAFMTEFNNAVAEPSSVILDFANAYRDAMSIVANKMNPINNFEIKVKAAINDLIEKLSISMTDESISKLAEIAGRISDGTLSANKVIESFRPKGE